MYQGGERGEADECTVEVGGVWDLASVEKNATRYQILKTHNMFGKLASLDEEHETSSQDDEHEISDSDVENFPVLTFETGSGRNEKDNKKGWTRVEKKRWKKMSATLACVKDEVCVNAVEESSVKMCLGFQVADVKKPLISVKRICEKGNLVS